MSHKKLYRSRSDKMISGVCGGLGEYFDIDPVLFRAVFVILAITNGTGFLLYLILMLVIPSESDGDFKLNKEKIESVIKESAETMKNEAEKIAKKIEDSESWFYQAKNIIGLIIIAIGVTVLIHQIFPVYWLGIRVMGPLVVVFIGLYIILKNKNK